MQKQSRRRFLQATAVAAALPLAADAGEPASADASLLAIVRLRFKHMTEDQLKAVQGSLRSGLAAAAVLKRVRLAPVDEPATVFVADVAE